MAGRESRQCPYFDTHSGVCGCPEFWKPAERSLNNPTWPTHLEITNSRRMQTANNRQISASLSLTSLPEHTKIQQATPAPPGPPQETCFFWYHGTCRRCDNCERPHEAHPTWPIPPPPKYRHFQPCTLPLCPLRTDLVDTNKHQEFQSDRGNLGSQMDGTVFSRATTAGENSNDSDDSHSTDNDISDAEEVLSPITTDSICSEPLNDGITPQATAISELEEGSEQEGELEVQREKGSHDADIDYVDLSLLLSPPLHPPVQEELLLSISHLGTLSKRCQPPQTNSPHRNTKRTKLIRDTSPDLSNVISILERPRNMSQWDIKPASYRSDVRGRECEVAPSTPTHDTSPQPHPRFSVKDDPVTFEPQQFNLPTGPRSMSTSPLICFYFYHKGYCNPRRGRTCDYLHDMNTPQQTVSLPACINNHDPACSLPMCPIRRQNGNQVKEESMVSAPNRQVQIKHEPMTSPRTNSLPVREFLDSSPRDSILSARDRYPRGMVGQQLPKLTGVARQCYKEQKRRIEQLQAQNNVNLVSATAAVGSTTQEQKGKQGKKRRRGKKGGTRLRAAMSRSETQEKESIQQDINSPPGIIDTQRPQLALPVKEETSVPTVPPPVGDPHRKRRLPRERNKKPLHSQRAGQLWFQDTVKDESVQTFTHGVMQDSTPSWALTGFPSSPRASNLPGFERVQQKDVNKVVDMVDQMNQDPRKWRQLSTNSQGNTLKAVVLYEYSQEFLGMTSGERQTEIHKQQAVMNKAYDQTQCQNDASKDSSSKGEYKLPEGDQRLDWDTDLVRRLFGEIE